MKKSFLLFKAFLCFFVISLVCGCSSAKISSESNKVPMDPAIVQGQLDNGMSYFVRKNSEPKNRIVLRLVVRAGSNMEEDDQRGVAHFIEHLAFNGTKNFEKSAIVDYFEKIGMDFGSDLNAYTSFDETVYKLEIPADNPEMLKTAMLILHDWASEVSFPQEEIDKERGVVTEEWRLRQGLQGRETDALLPFLLKDSRYKDRLPIGDMDIIHNITRERILDFYKKWYRPEFMSVIVVGDADTSVLEEAVKKTMGGIPASDKSVVHPEYKVEPQEEKNAFIFRDAEQKYTVVEIFQQDADFSAIDTEDDAKKYMAIQIAGEILNDRYKEISDKPDSPWYEAFVDQLRYTNTTNFGALGFVPKAGRFTESFKSFLDEYDRFIKYGATDSEVNRCKDSILNGLEQVYKNKDKIKSSTHADNLVKYVTCGETVTSEDYNYELYKEILKNITTDEINDAFRSKYENRGTLFWLMCSDKTGDAEVDNITEDEIKNIWINYDNGEDLEAYEDDVSSEPLMEKPAEKGKVVSEKEIPEYEAKEYIFENGIRIITKKTDFAENTINMTAFSNGGLYSLDDSDVPSAKYCVDYKYQSGFNGLNITQFEKKISTKNIDFDFNVNAAEENISGTASHEDFEVLMQIVNLLFTDSQFTDDAWEVLMNNVTETASKHGLQPRDVFSDRIREILYGKNIYSQPMDLDYAAKLNQEKAEKLYKERFGNAADFTFIFTGDFDDAVLLETLSSYLGTLKTSSQREEKGVREFGFPEGITVETVKKGLDEQGQVFIGFGGQAGSCDSMEQRYYDAFMASELCSLLDIRLREVIREDKGGSYGVGAYGGIDSTPNREYSFEVDFGCEPSREEELTAEVLHQIELLQENPVSQDYIDKLQETLRRNRETNLRNNSWWTIRIKQGYVEKKEPLWVGQDIEKLAGWITPEALQEQAKKYLNTKNYVAVYLKPEK